MRPLRLSMKGFGAFREPTQIEFGDIDLVALVGPTGSGKSTIIDAITFALYGTVARYENNRLVAPVINQTSNEARVTLEFELGGQVFTAVRIVRRTTSGASTREARLERSEDVIAGDARSMSKEVQVLLGLDVEQFNRTVVLPQGKFAVFLHDKPSDRQTTLVQLLGMGLYRRIGQEARKTAARAKYQLDALRPDLDDETKRLTDERRSRLEDRVARLDGARSQFEADRITIDDLDADLQGLKGRIELLGGQIDRMSKVEAPVALAELADQIAAAEKAQADAEMFRAEWNTKRRLAAEALENGPDIASVRLDLTAHAELAQRIRQREDIAKQLDDAASESESTSRAAKHVREVQAKLDRYVEESRAMETSAREARDAADITVTQIDAWATAHRRYQAATKDAADSAEATEAAEAAVGPLRSALKDAQSAGELTATRVSELRRRAGVLGHLDLLEIGEDCPLCLQEVHELPAHELNTDLNQAEADNNSAIATRNQVKEEFGDAETILIELRADAASVLKTLKNYECDIASIPPSDQLERLRARAAELTEAVRNAKDTAQQAEAKARQHRESTTNAEVLEAETGAFGRVTRLTESESLLRSQLTSLRDEVAELPSEDELRAELDKAERLRKEHQRAECRFNGAETVRKRATTVLAAVNKQRERAVKLLHASRDQVAAFGPPAVDPTDLVAAWATLTEWTRDQAHTAAKERQAAVEEQSAKEDQRGAVLKALRARCVEVLGPVDPDATVRELGDLLTERRATAEADLTHFDERRIALEKLRERVGLLTEEAHVADKLGYLLRTDGFERWLLETALDQLVEGATKRLFELSGGQYSLTVDKHEFAVRDHANADELRSARTLSGGETFLASLSLALALADATAEMAPPGTPRMESIFLDEGFGTLDPYTLDTVASAVEELGVTGRFVGIVTHIRELADRMPVRLEVTKTGGSATVERVET